VTETDIRTTDEILPARLSGQLTGWLFGRAQGQKYFFRWSFIPLILSVLIILIKRLPEPVSDRKLIKCSHGGTTSKLELTGQCRYLVGLLKYFDRAAQMLRR
jgi:hypothetical protein